MEPNVLKQMNTYYSTGIYAFPKEDLRAEEEMLTPHSTIPSTMTHVSKIRSKKLNYSL